MFTYTYTISNEGIFEGFVYNDKEIIFSMDNEILQGLYSDSKMKSPNDIRGLKGYLVLCGKMKPKDELKEA